MGFLKKLLSGANKVVGAVTGVAAKILPAPIGTAAKAVSVGSSFAGKLLDTPTKAKATASVGAAAAAAVLPTTQSVQSASSIPDIKIGQPENFWSKNKNWILATIFILLTGGLGLVLVSKSKR